MEAPLLLRERRSTNTPSALSEPLVPSFPSSLSWVCWGVFTNVLCFQPFPFPRTLLWGEADNGCPTLGENSSSNPNATPPSVISVHFPLQRQQPGRTPSTLHRLESQAKEEPRGEGMGKQQLRAGTGEEGEM